MNLLKTTLDFFASFLKLFAANSGADRIGLSIDDSVRLGDLPEAYPNVLAVYEAAKDLENFMVIETDKSEGTVTVQEQASGLLFTMSLDVFDLFFSKVVIPAEPNPE